MMNQEKRVPPASARRDFCCKNAKYCGGCRYSGTPYEEQLKIKQKKMQSLLGSFAPVLPIIGMEDPLHYRNKVHHVFAYSKKTGIISGSYRQGTHDVIDVDDCLVEDVKSLEIIRTVLRIAKKYKMTIFDEDTGYGLLRHVLVRRGFMSGEIMVVVVLSSNVFPGKNNFIKELRKVHPEITTIVMNINNKKTSMVLGDREEPIFGPGFIRDTLCGNIYRISPKSFYQVNPVQTEKLYSTAIEYAGLTGKETVIDAYCGIGTIGMTAASEAKEVIGVELNPDAVRDAKINAQTNKITNIRFIQDDASDFMEKAAAQGQKADVVFMDPPRSGSTEKFMTAAMGMEPSRIVYVSCGPDTLKRDLAFFAEHGYQAEKTQPVDMFPWTEHVETVCLLSRNK